MAADHDLLVTEEDIHSAYRLLFGRYPDPDGLHNFRAMIGHTTVDELTASLMSSEEFRQSPIYRAISRSENTGLVARRCAGLTLFVSPDDLLNRSIFERSSYEPHLSTALSTALRSGMVFCDIGANIGYHATHAARAVGTTGRVIAFEARPTNVQMIRLNALANHLTNLVVLPFAVSNSWCLYRYVPAQGTNGYIEPASTADPSQLAISPLVQGVRLDDLGQLFGRLDAIHLDVEGAEGLVIDGAMELLRRTKPIIFTEFCIGQLRQRSRREPLDFLQQLVELGYALEVIGFDFRAIQFNKDASALVEYATKQPTSHVDLRCIHTP